MCPGGCAEKGKIVKIVKSTFISQHPKMIILILNFDCNKLAIQRIFKIFFKGGVIPSGSWWDSKSNSV